MQTYPTGYAESHRIAEQIFREILPRHGMAVREEQIALCHEILDTLYNKEISLCEAGVGIGKTLAYLVACILWQMHRPSQLKMPVVISTSSVALQDAILNEYLPDLSAIMLAEGIITAPITAVVRKGKERFVCDARLAERQEKAISKGKRQKNSLRMAESILDLDHIPNLTRYDRCRICVPQSCPRDCFLRLDCRYQQYLRDSMKPDIQICNHNYLLANASHRLEERPLLLRQYQVLVVDEAHKLPDARGRCTQKLCPRRTWMTCAPCYSRHISRAYPSGCGRRFSRFPFPAHQDLLCRKGKSVYRSALRLSDKLHWPTVSAFCSTLAANRICRTTCNIGWQKQKVCCAFFSWMCRRASCTLSFPQTANSHSARPATAYRSYSAAPCGIPVSQPF